MGRGRAGGKTAGRGTSADHLPHGAHTVSVCLPFTLWISTLVSHWWILSSYKTLCYLHSLLIKKGKETPRALTTGEKTRKERKGKEKERKDGALWVAEIKWSENLMCKAERIKKNTESLKMVLIFLSNTDSVKKTWFSQELGPFVMLGRKGTRNAHRGSLPLSTHICCLFHTPCTTEMVHSFNKYL